MGVPQIFATWRPFQSGDKPIAWLSMAPSPAHSLMLEMSPLRLASAHEGKQDGTFITSKQFAPGLEWSVRTVQPKLVENKGTAGKVKTLDN